jgi:hypothetical protein
MSEWLTIHPRSHRRLARLPRIFWWMKIMHDQSRDVEKCYWGVELWATRQAIGRRGEYLRQCGVWTALREMTRWITSVGRQSQSRPGRFTSDLELSTFNIPNDHVEHTCAVETRLEWIEHSLIINQGRAVGSVQKSLMSRFGAVIFDKRPWVLHFRAPTLRSFVSAC